MRYRLHVNAWYVITQRSDRTLNALQGFIASHSTHITCSGLSAAAQFQCCSTLTVLSPGYFDMPRGPATVFNVSSKYSLMRLVINATCKFTVTHNYLR